MMAMWLVLVSVKEWVVLGVVVNFGVSDCDDCVDCEGNDDGVNKVEEDDERIEAYFASIIAFRF